ncbi:MAG TPA: CDP-alcohol phosphatidyltransferase family protein [Candidatus Limnocylindria bacterium]|nr:CDP-alcohol phosphatidyltransferase family protein [Candidatus Limnocylindria bacterium]
MFHLFKKLPPHEKRMTLSTFITLVRIALVPFIVWAMVVGLWGHACILFCIAAVTDVLDGTLARWRKEQTFLGASLDPIADKLLLLSCFSTLAWVQTPLFAIPLWFVGTILLKDTIVLGGALFLYLYKGRLDIRPTVLGKATTLLQVIFIIWLFACYFWHWMPVKTYYTMLGSVVTVVIISLLQYIGLGWQQFKS